MTAEIAEHRRFKMTFIIDSENNITAHVTPEEAVAATATPFDSFASEQKLAELAVQWPTERLVAIWNCLPGITDVKRFKDRKTAVGRIWTRIQGLGEPEAQPEATPAHAKPRDLRAKAKASKKASRANGGPKAKRGGKTREASAPRDGSKTATVVALLERAKGATLAELMDKMGWQAHTVRGFMAGAMRKAGYAVESFKPEGGRRTYRINR
jgi:hypothetical protein